MSYTCAIMSVAYCGVYKKAHPEHTCYQQRVHWQAYVDAWSQTLRKHHAHCAYIRISLHHHSTGYVCYNAPKCIHKNTANCMDYSFCSHIVIQLILHGHTSGSPGCA
ncbi:hypothetical protein ABBQ38_004665 [Trebouxia sp. C0009 RCD-2024]